MKKLMRNLMRYQYAWIAGSYVAICAIFLTLGFQNIRKMIVEYNKEQTEMVTGLLVENVNSELDNLVTQVERVANVVLKNSETNEEKYRDLQNYQKQSCFDSIGYMDSRNRFFADKVEKDNLIHLGLVSEAASKESTYITNPYRSNITGQYVLTIFVPVYSEGKRAGMVYANLDLAQIAQFANNNSINLPARICMVNADSLNYIACTDTEDVPAGSWYSLMLKREDMTFDADEVYNECIAQMRKDVDEGTLCFAMNGRDYTLGYSNIDNMPNWYLALVLENTELSNDFTKFRDVIYRNMSILILLTALYAVGIIIKELIQRRNFQNLATLDAMTGIYNKRTFEAQVRDYITTNAGRLSGALLFIDVDDFKKYNDAYGPLNGDIVFKAFASSIKKKFESSGVVGRYGGDEFVVFVKNGYDRTYIEHRMQEIREELLEIELEGFGKVPAHFSSGGACYPADGIDYEELCNSADKALYQVKESGKDKFFWYR